MGSPQQDMQGRGTSSRDAGRALTGVILSSGQVHRWLDAPSLVSCRRRALQPWAWRASPLA